MPLTPRSRDWEHLSRMHLAADGRPLVAACYIVQDRRLLMVCRRLRDGRPEWTGPSGNVEAGETPEEAAVREVKEEVGLTVEVARRLGERVHPATGRHLVYFICRALPARPPSSITRR